MTFDEMTEALIRARRGRGSYLPQRVVAERMGIVQSYVSDLERGMRSGSSTPSIDSLERYANALGYVIVYDLKKVEEME